MAGDGGHAAVELAQACAKAMWAEDRASTGLGMRLDGVAPGHARISMIVTEAMVNGHGICHGGFIFTLADSALAFAGNTYGERAVAQHCDITFLQQVRLGETLHAEAMERIRRGRSGMYDVRVMNSDDQVVAELRGHIRLLGRKFFQEQAHGGA